MIAVIADDFTGAAELAGISLRYGLTVELFLAEITAANADVIIVCTDSRSQKIEEAKKLTADAIKNIIPLRPRFIYKKIDSVLRGYVVEEVKVQMKLCGFEKVLILPANPTLGRTINNGEYFINGKRITETGFAADPEFPIRSSLIKDMIGNHSVSVLKHTDELPGKGIVIGEATQRADIEQWIAVNNEEWMLVGAGDFYSAILDKNYQAKTQPTIEVQLPHLYVCGTAFDERKKYVKTLNEKQDCVAYLPEKMTDTWVQQTCDMLRIKNKAVVAIKQGAGDATELRLSMAKTVKEILKRENVKEIFIEGGSTAAAVLNELGIQKLSPVNEMKRGVVRMKAKDLFITVKPGSYELPAEIKMLYM
jgi:uncharacterized protein YgbK (DUF1537 family)